MNPTHTPQRCRWAMPTLDLPLPYWLDAWDSPWSCRRDPNPRVLESSLDCQACPRWEERAEAGPHWTLSLAGL